MQPLYPHVEVVPCLNDIDDKEPAGRGPILGFLRADPGPAKVGWPDFHFGHFNIIRYCNRPFARTEEMDACILDRMNAHVKQNDTLYFLGDFCMGNVEKVAAYRQGLSCKTIHFVDGNHDKVTRKLQHLFASWSSLSEIQLGKQRIVLCHYAMRVWPHHARGAWQLYGHSHGNLPDDPLSLSMDVGVDSHGFCPWQVQAVMNVKATAREQSSEAPAIAVWAALNEKSS